jgi:hypothetical protein
VYGEDESDDFKREVVKKPDFKDRIDKILAKEAV